MNYLNVAKQPKYLTLWIIERRMYQARRLLLDTERAIAQIGTDTGYVDTSYFIRQFKQLHGTFANLWRNSPQNGENH